MEIVLCLYLRTEGNILFSTLLFLTLSRSHTTKFRKKNNTSIILKDQWIFITLGLGVGCSIFEVKIHVILHKHYFHKPESFPKRSKRKNPRCFAPKILSSACFFGENRRQHWEGNFSGNGKCFYTVLILLCLKYKYAR